MFSTIREYVIVPFIFVTIISKNGVFGVNMSQIIEPSVSDIAYIQKCPEAATLEGIETLILPSYLSTEKQNITFRLGPYITNCAFGQTFINLIVLINKKGISNEKASPTFQFTPDGNVTWPGMSTNQSTPHFCIMSASSTSIEISICLINCDEPSMACIPKCCEKEQLFDRISKECIPANREWTPTLHHKEKFTKLEDYEKLQLMTHVVPMLKYCKPLLEDAIITTDQRYVVSDEGHTELRLLTNGIVMAKWHTDEEWDAYPLDVCLDGDSQGEENVLIDLDCKEKPKPDIYQTEERKASMLMTINVIHAVLMILCSVFLLAAMMIYIALWEKQNTHGWTVLTYIVSLFFAYIFLAIYKFLVAYQTTSVEHGGIGCKINGVLAHFFFESVFTWLTVINFDIWWKFWDLKSKPIKAKEIKRYLTYATFAFGIPFLIVIIGLILEEKKIGITPGYGKGGNCFLQPIALGVYLYYPIGVLMILNFIFFISTAFRIYAHFRLTTHVHEAKAEQELESCKVIVKLFVVMGVTWVFELLSFLIDKKSSSDSAKIVWSILDCANILQALGIFYVFIWKRLILTQLWQKYPFLRPLLRPLKGVPGCKKRIDYRTSSRLTTKKSIDMSTNSQKKSAKERNRKLSSDSGQRTSIETVELEAV